MARTSNLANVATVTRASKAWDPLWNFTSGGTVGTLTEYASGVARYGSNGLLVEEASTNHITNPRCEGSTPGDVTGAGALPTDWTFFENGSVVSSVVAAGTEGGWPYLEMSFVGTAGGVEVSLVLFESASVVSASAAQTWTGSAGYKIVSGSLANVTTFEQYTISYDGGVPQEQLVEAITLDATHRRHYSTETLGGGTVDSVANGFRLVFAAGAVNLTIRVYAPQLENKAYPTSPILPVAGSPAASTRSADIITVANGAWSNDNGAGTLYADVILNYPGVAGTYPRIVAYGVTGGNEVGLLVLTDTAVGFSGRYSDVGQFDLVQISLTGAGQNVKAAAAFSANDVAVSAYGETQGTDSSATITFGNSGLGIGCSFDGLSSGANFYLKDLRYWPRRLSNAELEALVGN